MELLEITEKERVGREVAANRLHALADALSRHNDVEFERGGLRFKVRVPDQVELKIEFEVEDDETELEIELRWPSRARQPSSSIS
jgi:amphi-Trp domain-containing protein